MDRNLQYMLKGCFADTIQAADIMCVVTMYTVKGYTVKGYTVKDYSVMVYSVKGRRKIGVACVEI